MKAKQIIQCIAAGLFVGLLIFVVAGGIAGGAGAIAGAIIAGVIITRNLIKNRPIDSGATVERNENKESETRIDQRKQ